MGEKRGLGLTKQKQKTKIKENEDEDNSSTIQKQSANMGSLSKTLGQLTAKSLESESSQIIRTIASNKVPNSLSQRLDTTLKDSHDMKVFGLGTLSSMSSVDRYTRFTHSLYGVYSTLEEELEKSSSSSPAIESFWKNHESILKRSEKLRLDLEDVGCDFGEYTPATMDYISTIRSAGEKDREDNGGRLLGHAYTRYLADLMGGQVLGTPTRLALGLKEGTPRQYSFTYGDGMDRKMYVEKIYKDLNDSGDLICPMKSDKLETVVSEARTAFKCNIQVYSEEPIWIASTVGLKNIAFGYLWPKKNQPS